MGVPNVPSGGSPLYEDPDGEPYCICNELSIKPREGIPYVSLRGGSPNESLDGAPYDSLGGGGLYTGVEGDP